MNPGAAVGTWRELRRERVSSVEETNSMAAWLAGRLSGGEAVALLGPLGAGKTTFVRGIVRELGYHGRVRSPSFGLAHPYPTDPPLLHVDLYRVADVSELLVLALEEAGEEGVLLVEWGDRLGGAWGEADWRVRILPGAGETERLITIERRRT